MLDFQIPRITSESVEQNRGTFTIEPLDRGLRLHVRQLAAARAALLARRRGRHQRAHRGRGARVLDDPGRQGGRDRHRPEPQGHRLPHALRRQRGRGSARRHRPRRDHRQGHRPPGRRRDPQPRPAHRDAREENQARAVHDDRPRPRLPARRGEQVGRPADRRDPDRLDLLARCAASPTPSSRPASARRPTSTSSRSTSRPTARSTPRRRCARPPSC